MPRCSIRARIVALSAVIPASTGSSSAGHRGAELRVPLERALRLVASSERAVGERERIVRGAELRKERDRALQVRDGRVVPPSAAAMRPSPNSAAGLGRRLSHQRLEQARLSSRSPASNSASASFTRAGR